MKFIEIHFYCSLPLFFKKVSVLYIVFIVKSKGPLTLLLLASVKFRGGGLPTLDTTALSTQFL